MKTSWLVLAAIVGAFLFSSTPSARADDASRLQAAQNLLLALHMDTSYANMVDQMLDAQIKSSPQLAQLRDPMKAFLDKYMGWNAMKDDLAQIYANNFTEDELNQITAFYKTPAGTKLAMSVPTLTAQGMQLGQRKVSDHIGELQEMIRKAMADKSAASGAPSPAPASTPTPAPSPAPAPGSTDGK